MVIDSSKAQVLTQALFQDWQGGEQSNDELGLPHLDKFVQLKIEGVELAEVFVNSSKLARSAGP